jgi:Protein of unknown function (DUF3108)
MSDGRNIGMVERTLRVSLVVLCVVSMAWGQIQKSTPKKPASKQSTSAQKKTARQKTADSLATARADSVRLFQTEQARQDSLKRAAEESERRRQDSIATFTLRRIENHAFGAGERLVFDIKYGVITAGEAIMSVYADSIDNRQCHRVEVQVNSLPSFSWIYRVEDRYLTFIDMEAMVPWRFEQHIREGSYQRDFVADFDQYYHQAKTTEGTYAIPPYVHDIMSAFFFVRTVDFTASKPGDLFSLQNFYKDKTHELTVKFLGRQELEVDAGTFRTIVVEPMVREGGLFKSEGRIVVWLTDDDRKLPIRVNAKILIGSIDTELREYSGLRGPLPSRIQ